MMTLNEHAYQNLPLLGSGNLALLLYLRVIPLLRGLLLFLNVLFRVHRPDTEKVSPYECGINPVGQQTRQPFQVQFYLVGILFLIFDLEVAILYPLRLTLDEVGLYGF